MIDSILAKIDTSPFYLLILPPFISRFNDSTSVNMDAHFLNVIKKSIDTYRQTDGIFDITVQPLVQAWGFGPKKIGSLPDSDTIKASRNA